MKKRTRLVKIANLPIGAGNPVRIKGMLKTSTDNLPKLVKEAKTLEKEGAEAIRLAIKDKKALNCIKKIKKSISVGLVADIHFDYKLALAAIEEGIDSVRINPMNITNERYIKQIAQAAKKAGISIRVGVNSGGFHRRFANNYSLAKAMVKTAQKAVKILEKQEFFDIMVSLKAAQIETTIVANRLFAQKYNYPLHIGVTATGTFIEGIIKSAIGIGTLLFEGIGDIIRVSLTAPSYWEIRVAKMLLQALGKRKFTAQVISCPTCSRCEVDLMSLVKQTEKVLKNNPKYKDLMLAIMGCVVNGPGEAIQADLGAAFGKEQAVIFKKGKILGKTDKKNFISDLIKYI